MDIANLEEAALTSISHSPNGLHFELSARLASGEQVALFSYNREVSPIKVEYHGLKIRAGLQESGGSPSLGEIESVGVEDGRITLEGDFGVIIVEADMCELRAAS